MNAPRPFDRVYPSARLEDVGGVLVYVTDKPDGERMTEAKVRWRVEFRRRVAVMRRLLAGAPELPPSPKDDP